MGRVLVTVSRFTDPDVMEKVTDDQRPLPDYIAMARTFPADYIDYIEARRTSGWLGKLLEHVGGPNLMLAWAAFTRRHDYDVVFTDGEHVGIPFALLCKLARWRRTRHLMIVHIISVFKKMIFHDLLRVHSHIDIFFVYSTWQKRFIEQRWKIPSQRVVFTPFMVDTRFFNPSKVKRRSGRMICSAGLEFRDYETMIKAVDGLDVEVVIAAASPYSKRADTTIGVDLPPNVTVRRLNHSDLRQLYADSRFVVMPLFPVNFQAGVTAILEAMAMERAVICTQTPGQTDVVIEGKTGLYVPPRDPDALRAAIKRLLDDPALAKRMGEAGRRRIEEEMTLDCYVERLARYVRADLP